MSCVCDENSFAASCINLTFQSNTDNEFIAVISDADEKAIDITGDTITLTVTSSLGGVVVFTHSNAAGGHEDPTKGQTRFSVSRADLVAASSTATTTWVYEIRRIVGGAGDQHVHIWGRFIVEPT